jgi:hypothetical protein
VEKIKNLVKVFDAADKIDIKIAEDAWFKMNRLTSRIAEKYEFSSRIGAAVFAALSPNNDYHGNLRDTDRVLRSVREGGSVDDLKVSTYGNNKRKAWRIANGEEPLDLIVFPKTKNFFLNIVDPLDPEPVTVDGHIYNAWNFKRLRLQGSDIKMNHRVYEEIANDMRELARMKGMLPNVAQGVVWYSWKRLHRILYSPQLEFWDRESIAAKIGWAASDPVV